MLLPRPCSARTLSQENCSTLTPSARFIRPQPEALPMGDHPHLDLSDHCGAIGGLSWVSGSALGSGTRG